MWLFMLLFPPFEALSLLNTPAAPSPARDEDFAP